MTDHCLVLVTCGSAKEAVDISRHLVEERLAAGVQSIPISSVYRWDGEIVEDDEALLVCKTRSDLFSRIEAAVNERHSYDVAPILKIDITAAAPSLSQLDRR